MSGRRVAFVMAAGLIAVAGCSSDDDASSTPSEVSETTVASEATEPPAGTTTINMSRLAATGDRQGNLFVNPGGPGGSGVDFNFSFMALGSPEWSEAYDLVGFDPRGVGTSDPLGCLDLANDCPLGSSADEVEAKVTELFATAAAPLYAQDTWPICSNPASCSSATATATPRTSR